MVTTIVSAVVGVVLAGATIAGVITSVSSGDRPAPDTSNVQLYGAP